MQAKGECQSSSILLLVAGRWEDEGLKIIHARKSTCAAICNMALGVAGNWEAEDLKIISKNSLKMRYAIWDFRLLGTGRLKT